MSIANAAHCSMMGGDGKWRNPYVTNGLVAMWDGAINDNSQNWTDIINGYTAIKERGSITWSNNACNLNNSPLLFNDNGISLIRDAVASGNFTIEICGTYGSTAGGAMVSTGDVVRSGLVPYKYQGNDLLYSKMEYYSPNQGWGIAYVGYPASQGLSRGTFFTATLTCASHTTERCYANGEYKRQITVRSGGGSRGASFNCIVFGDDQNGSHFWGSINCCRFYDRALSDSEIVANKTVDASRFN